MGKYCDIYSYEVSSRSPNPMQVCQNSNCQNPFNPDTSQLCQTCGSNQLGKLFRNHYRIMEVLGEGRFGKTFLAQDADKLDLPCVIKQFAPQVGGEAALGEATELFKQEVQRLYELGENHSQVPKLIAYFEEGKSLYLVQEFIPGQNLLTELQQQAYTEQQIWELLADLLPVLKFIHQHNVIHRDIKPENIIRRQTPPLILGRQGGLVLIDFGGIKQITQTSLARKGTGIYTLGYAPTEQMAGYPSPASDLYCLGATCARLLTQCLPTQDEYGNIHDSLYDVMNAKWLWRERLSERGVTLSNQLEQILDKLLQHLPKDRYQSVDEVLKDLNPSPPPQQPPHTQVQSQPLDRDEVWEHEKQGESKRAGEEEMQDGQEELSPLSFSVSPMSLPTTDDHTPHTSLEQDGEMRDSPPQEPPYTPSEQTGESKNSPLLFPSDQEKVAVVFPPRKEFEFDVVTVDGRGKIINREGRTAQYFVETLHATSLQENGGILEMVSIPGSTFLMGSPDNENYRGNHESPQHEVTISPFFIGKTPVTQAQWQAVAALPEVNQPLAPDPSSFKGENQPVERVSWKDAVEFCARLSKKTGREYRLPSEAEWEYACRAGTTTPFHFGQTITPELANYYDSTIYSLSQKGKSPQMTTSVGSFQVANAFGLYDMHGNVWEWCADLWHDNYVGAPSDGSVWELGGNEKYRVLRGGSWSDYARACRSACRDLGELGIRFNLIGFRVACAWA